MARLAHAVQAAATAELDRLGRQVDALGGSEARELDDVAARCRSRRRGCAARGPTLGAAHERPEDPAARPEPPVALLHVVVLLEGPVLHEVAPAYSGRRGRKGGPDPRRAPPAAYRSAALARSTRRLARSLTLRPRSAHRPSTRFPGPPRVGASGACARHRRHATSARGACRRGAARLVARGPALAAALVYAVLSLVFVGQGLLPGPHAVELGQAVEHGAVGARRKPDGVRALGANYELADAVAVFQPVLRAHARARCPTSPLWNSARHGRPAVPGQRAVGRLLAVHVPVLRPAAVDGAGRRWRPSSCSSPRSARTSSGGRWACASAARCWPGWSSPSGRSSWSGSPGRSRTSSRCCRGCSCSPSWSSGGPGRCPVAGLAALVALQFLGGHPETSFHVMVAVVVFFAFRRTAGAARRGAASPEALRPRCFAAGAGRRARRSPRSMLVPLARAARALGRLRATRIEDARATPTAPTWAPCSCSTTGAGRRRRRSCGHRQQPRLLRGRDHADAGGVRRCILRPTRDAGGASPPSGARRWPSCSGWTRSSRSSPRCPGSARRTTAAS